MAKSPCGHRDATRRSQLFCPLPRHESSRRSAKRCLQEASTQEFESHAAFNLTIGGRERTNSKILRRDLPGPSPHCTNPPEVAAILGQDRVGAAEWLRADGPPRGPLHAPPPRASYGSTCTTLASGRSRQDTPRARPRIPRPRHRPRPKQFTQEGRPGGWDCPPPRSSSLPQLCGGRVGHVPQWPVYRAGHQGNRRLHVRALAMPKSPISARNARETES